WHADRRRRTLRRAARPLRPSLAGRRLRARGRFPAHRPDGRGARDGSNAVMMSAADDLSRAGGSSGATDGLTIAVPRGALFKETVDLLSGLGLDTSELRSNDRKL